MARCRDGARVVRVRVEIRGRAILTQSGPGRPLLQQSWRCCLVHVDMLELTVLQAQTMADQREVEGR